ncbi:MAG TPA: undecaprenyl-diphosphate phosphatase [Steroidobacteraceae bacterium]|nr:undecaprenyl-diphosphate phosphatase [Steroidobacteraceae bacterium]
MDVVIAIKALILGVVEGLTEFLPVSSTGHLILVSSLLDWNDEKGKLFDIVIQFAAILAVVWDYRRRLWEVVERLPSDPKARRFAFNIVLAFLPAAVLGLMFEKAIKRYLFAAVPVATAFIVGGLIILWIESRPRRARVDDVDGIRPADAVIVGFAQALAMVPGTSRSGATIMGGLLRGLSRKAATEFSFFLAIPTMFAATAYELFKARHELSFDDLSVIGLGSVASFVSAAFAVRALIRYISAHDFKIFAWYRIAFGLLILATWYFGWVKWG